jgi:hypothetical protein
MLKRLKSQILEVALQNIIMNNEIYPKLKKGGALFLGALNSNAWHAGEAEKRPVLVHGGFILACELPSKCF